MILVLGGWLGGWVAGSYSDIKTKLCQVGLDWEWPTGLSLAKFTRNLLGRQVPSYFCGSFHRLPAFVEIN